MRTNALLFFLVELSRSGTRLTFIFKVQVRTSSATFASFSINVKYLSIRVTSHTFLGFRSPVVGRSTGPANTRFSHHVSKWANTFLEIPNLVKGA